MLQQMPGVRATTLLEELQRLHPGRYPRPAAALAAATPCRALARTTYRGSRARADLSPGASARPAGPVGFHRWRRPGHQDWRRAVRPSALPFLAGLQRLTAGRFKAICGGESFTALTEGLRGALRMGGVPKKEHRTDRLWAAYLATRKTRPRATRPSAGILSGWSRRATTQGSPTRTAPVEDLARPSMKRAGSRKRCSAARLTRFRRSRRLSGLPCRDDDSREDTRSGAKQWR